MDTPLKSRMLELFLSGVEAYQPKGLDFESGDPQTARRNIEGLLKSGRKITFILCRPSGVLIQFDSGEQYYTPGLYVGTDEISTILLAEIATQARFGLIDELLDLYSALPMDYEGPLPSLVAHLPEDLRTHLPPSLQAASVPRPQSDPTPPA